ncbi:MAG: HD domain-containing protein [Chloroflexi bacterium]|nr:HD domain-containing protein [Chloroflexota bacterium]
MVEPESNSHAQLIEAVRAALPDDLPCYLVGGAVRDQLRGESGHDLDFVLPRRALEAGRRVANALHGAYYPMDEKREIARILLRDARGERLILDFSVQRGDDLESDLRLRDFTINAMALDVRHPQTLIDPLRGAADLHAGLLRACSPGVFYYDPLRVLRGVRLAARFKFRIHAKTLDEMRRAAGGLFRISPERVRDELFRIFELPNPATALRLAENIGALSEPLPELGALKGVIQSPPHTADVWEHTLGVVSHLAAMLELLATQYDPDAAGSLAAGLATLRLGRYRAQLDAHLRAEIIPGRNVRALLFLAALYHDVAKPQTRSVDEDGRVRFFDHDQRGAEIAAARGAELQLSNDEVARLRLIVRHHLRPLLLGQGGELPTRRAVYRFFRDTGEAGVDICLLSLADMQATYGPGLQQDDWSHHLDVIRLLLEAWWEQADEQVNPPALLNGGDLMAALNIKPGPLVGRLLEAIREAQACGEINDSSQALELARRLLAEAQG